jgi:mono/diheme cytochrome c family protein
MRRPIALALSAAALVAGALLLAGCGSEGVHTATPETVEGNVPTVPTQTTPAVKGNPVAGKAVYASSGCGGCHTYTPAGTKANVGPDLDQLPDYAARANEPLDEFTRGSITNPPPSYVPPGYPRNVMPTTFGQTLSEKQLADLVAFLTQKS